MSHSFRWSFTVGDPTFMGWFITLVYLFLAICTLPIVLKISSIKNSSRSSYQKWEYFFWYGVTVFLLFLGVNKQLDLQVLFADIIRLLLKESNLYEIRRFIQLILLFGGALLGIIFMTTLAKRYTLLIYKNRTMVFGLLCLITFILVRALSFHYSDALLDIFILGVDVNSVLELSSLIFVGFGIFQRIIR